MDFGKQVNLRYGVNRSLGFADGVALFRSNVAF